MSAIADWCTARRKTIEASIQTEVLARNMFKEQCERTALAEIQALEMELPRFEAELAATNAEIERMRERDAAFDPHVQVLNDRIEQIKEDSDDIKEAARELLDNVYVFGANEDTARRLNKLRAALSRPLV